MCLFFFFFLICAQMWLWNNFVFVSLHPGHRLALFEVGAQFVFVQQANVMAELWAPGCLQLTAVQLLSVPHHLAPNLWSGSWLIKPFVNYYNWAPTYGVCGRNNFGYAHLNSPDLCSYVNVKPFKVATCGGQKHSTIIQFIQLGLSTLGWWLTCYVHHSLSEVHWEREQYEHMIL